MAINRPGALDRVQLPSEVNTRVLITGTADVWENVTPAGIDLNGASNGGDNYGVQETFVNPVAPAEVFAYVCYQGVWKSNSYGAAGSWVKVSATAAMDNGKLWAGDIARDGSYMLAASGNNFSGTPEGRRQVWRSTDGGVNWTGNGSDLGGDPYSVRCSPYDTLRCLAATKDNPSKLLESADGGATWTDHGALSMNLSSAYVHYLHNSDTALIVGQDGGNSFRLTKSGGTWTPTQVTDLNGAGHYHGLHEIVYDSIQGAFWFPAAGGAAGTDGIWKSTNNGVNWTRVYSATTESVMVKTATKLYAQFGTPINGGVNDSKHTSADLNPGTTFATAQNLNTLFGMANGAKRIAATTDGSKWALIAGAWCAGIWRYVEP